MTNNFPLIRVEVKQERAIRFLWLKYVTGFNPKVHCARCLIGKYSKRFPYTSGYVPRQTIEGALDENNSPWIYLCAVTGRWEWNVHIAGQYEAGSMVTYSDDRIDVEIQNFKRTPIDGSKSPEAEPEFATCRNWQFGWMAFPKTEIQGSLNL
ncbi:MAG: hypothetical protein R3C03_09440 [Pirellulaceae bacterium]